jgi:hypothetical protein
VKYYRQHRIESFLFPECVLQMSGSLDALSGIHCCSGHTLEVRDEAQRRWERPNGQVHDCQCGGHNGAFCEAPLAKSTRVQHWRSRAGERDHEVLAAK